jgi:hypothetical protein
MVSHNLIFFCLLCSAKKKSLSLSLTVSLGMCLSNLNISIVNSKSNFLFNVVIDAHGEGQGVMGKLDLFWIIGGKHLGLHYCCFCPNLIVALLLSLSLSLSLHVSLSLSLFFFFFLHSKNYKFINTNTNFNNRFAINTNNKCWPSMKRAKRWLNADHASQFVITFFHFRTGKFCDKCVVLPGRWFAILNWNLKTFLNYM